MESATTAAPKRLLIVGAGGFIGGYMAQEALARGYEVHAGVRPSTSRARLTDPRLQFVQFTDWSDTAAVAQALGTVPYDVILYNLGVTKCTDYAEFNRVNYGYLKTFIEALRMTGAMPGRLVYISSLSVLGPAREKPGPDGAYIPFDGKVIPQPDTRYGVSKLKAETLLDMADDIPWTVLRPTGVYGPHDMDYRKMIECIDAGWDFSVGLKPQQLTFIYAADLARAALDAAESPATLRRKYIVSELQGYTQADFRRIVAKALGRKLVVPVRLPLWAVKGVSTVAEKIGVLRMKPSTLNRDKYRIMRQRNWLCDCTDAVRDFGFCPQVSLEEGVRLTVEAYLQDKQNKKSR